MIIFPLAFFLWIIFFVLIGGVVALSLRGRRRSAGNQDIDNVENEQQLSFAQRNWFLLCLVVAVLSPLCVHWIGLAAQSASIRQTKMEQHINGGTGSTSPSGGAVPPGDSARSGSIVPGANPANNTAVKDTSYHVATPPAH